MAIKYCSIFPTKTLQNLPNWDFWFEKNHLATLILTPPVLQSRKKYDFKQFPNCIASYPIPTYIDTARSGLIRHHCMVKKIRHFEKMLNALKLCEK
jgi:hypothetical protein